MCNHMQFNLAKVIFMVHSNSSVVNGSLNWFISNYNKIIRYLFQNYSPS